jgi:hypothetical protein
MARVLRDAFLIAELRLQVDEAQVGRAPGRAQTGEWVVAQVFQDFLPALPTEINVAARRQHDARLDGGGRFRLGSARRASLRERRRGRIRGDCNLARPLDGLGHFDQAQIRRLRVGLLGACTDYQAEEQGRTTRHSRDTPTVIFRQWLEARNR